MESVLDQLIAECNEAKTKLSEYNKYETSFAITEDKTQPLESRHKAAMSLYEKATENIAKWESSQNTLKNVRKILGELTALFDDKLNYNSDKTTEYNKIVEHLKSIEQEITNERMKELDSKIIPQPNANTQNEQVDALLSQYTSPLERSLLEKWSGLKFRKVLFDSTKDDYAVKTSIFGKRVSDVPFTCYLIQSENNCTFGGVSYRGIFNDPYQSSQIIDINAFAFKLEGEKSERYLARGNMVEFAIHMTRPQDEGELFSLFSNTILIMKKGNPRGKCTSKIPGMPYGKLCDGDNFILKKFAVFQLDI
ncbi:hypothetical protein EIN_453930 [Entamoeba invadens IP1]|uniref:TLDc domain-containing protein n=1 Tax=Entamoeba invadens IP1 TaxID=370355 RepID=L7FMW1_ENTIV|nr:hypothetical protein EIN_453930 [Entamoeba invadens IP1]ELP89703.1 hypothetical protein EIN_453930 [Entamoeba invadens IP1]|eukprot:XP_004256474.1 hypothetical protein EIN_453930 [Entamoeba invadens IP1]